MEEKTWIKLKLRKGEPFSCLSWFHKNGWNANRLRAQRRLGEFWRRWLRSTAQNPSSLDFFSEAGESFGLGLQTAEQLGIFDFPSGVEQSMDLGKEDADGKKVGVAIAENRLQLLDWAKRAPDSSRNTSETNRATLETFGKFQHIDEILQDARHTAIVFGCDNMEAGGLQHGFAKRQE